MGIVYIPTVVSIAKPKRSALLSAVIAGTVNRDNPSRPFVYHTKLARGLSHCPLPTLQCDSCYSYGTASMAFREPFQGTFHDLT